MVIMSLPSAGFHYGLSFDDYRALDAINIHGLMPMDLTPTHCRYALDNPTAATEPMDVGSATHVAILEPARFDKEFYIAPIYDGRTKGGKDIAERCQAEAAGRTIIRRKASESGVDADDVRGMADNIRRNSKVKMLINATGQCEVTALWKERLPAYGARAGSTR